MNKYRKEYLAKYKKLNGERLVGTIGPPKSNNPNGGEIFCKLCGASTWIGVGSINHCDGCPVIESPTEEELAAL
jgi:hypothetical protein